MITQMLMEPGSYRIPLNIGMAWDVLNTVDELGWIVVTSQWVDHRLHTDAAMLATSRYTGVVLEVDRLNGTDVVLGGQDLHWYLGDAYGHGDILDSYSTNTAGVNWQTQLNTWLPSSITAGTYTDPASTTVYFNQVGYISPAEAIRMILSQIDAEYRINPDGTIDAGDPDGVFNTTAPTVVATRTWSGGDPTYFGIKVTEMRTLKDATRFITGAMGYLVTNETSGGKDATFTATHSYKDIHGNALIHERALPITNRSSATGISSFTPDETDRWKVNTRIEIETDYWQLEQSTLEIGDNFYVFDPPLAEDTSNQIWFRGRQIAPLTKRFVACTWPVRDGMGVYYRDSAGTYTDLTRYVRWESTQPARLTLDDPFIAIPTVLQTYTTE